ncbi:MAG TPA: peptidoglycan-associated lipoprotein Pal, partial [Caldimonas sp.]
AGAGGTAQSQVASVDLTKGATAAASTLPRIVYFDFDSFVVKDEYRPTVDANAKALVADRKKHIVIEGHTDERGGREYNLALGQKRAEAVAKSMALLGANDSQIEAVSFGKERPAVQGSDEAAWAKNRRAEIVVR